MTADTVGGVWTYCTELAAALSPYGVEVVLATMGRPVTPAQREHAGVFADLVEGDFPLEWMHDPWDGVDAAGEWLLSLEERVRPDVVHLNGYVHAALPWQAPPLVVAHSDVLSWWHWVKGEPAPAEWDTYRERVLQGLRAAARVVAPTAAVAADLRREYGVTASVVPNCRSLDVPPAEKEPVVLAAGRVWDEAKGLTSLARVAGRLDAPVLVAGEGELDGVRGLGVLGQDELLGWMSRASVFAAPARYEPFGLGVLEAALAGCSLVLGDLPSLREVWGDVATYVRTDEELLAALQQALRHPVSARERALTYSRERTAAGYLAEYALLPVPARGAR